MSRRLLAARRRLPAVLRADSGRRAPRRHRRPRALSRRPAASGAPCSAEYFPRRSASRSSSASCRPSCPSAWPPRSAVSRKSSARSIFDPDARRGSEDLAVGRHPWVKEVADVRRILPNRIALDLRLRAPVGGRRGRRLAAHRGRRGHRCSRTIRRSRPRASRASAATRSASRAFRASATRSGVSRSPTGSRSSTDLAKNSAHAVFRYVDRGRHRRHQTSDRSGPRRSCSSSRTARSSSGAARRRGALGPIELPASRKLDNLLLVHDKNPGMQGVARINAATQDPFVTLSQ